MKGAVVSKRDLLAGALPGIAVEGRAIAEARDDPEVLIPAGHTLAFFLGDTDAALDAFDRVIEDRCRRRSSQPNIAGAAHLAVSSRAADAFDPRNPDSAAGRHRSRRGRREAPADSARHSAGAHRRRSGTHPRAAGGRAGSRARAAAGSAAGHLLWRRGDELARVPIQSASDLAACGGLRRVHDRSGRRGMPLAAGSALGGRLRARRHRVAARRGGATVDRPPHADAAGASGHPGRRGVGKRRDGADPLSLRRRGGELRRVLVRPRPSGRLPPSSLARSSGASASAGSCCGCAAGSAIRASKSR